MRISDWSSDVCSSDLGQIAQKSPTTGLKATPRSASWRIGASARTRAPAPARSLCPLCLLCNRLISRKQAGRFRPACTGAVPLDVGACRSTLVHLHAAFGCRKGDTDGSTSLSMEEQPAELQALK